MFLYLKFFDYNEFFFDEKGALLTGRNSVNMKDSQFPVFVKTGVNVVENIP